MNRLILIILLTAILFPPPIEKMRNNIKIILYLIGLICILQKNEGFGNIDAEALQNMASLYNSSTGVLKVNNIEASGYGKFGNAYIGKFSEDSNYMTVGHIDNNNKKYALRQNSAGSTIVNSGNGQSIILRHNDDVFDKEADIANTDHKPEIIFNGKNLDLNSTNLRAYGRENVAEHKGGNLYEFTSSIIEGGRITNNRIDTNHLNSNNKVGRLYINTDKKGSRSTNTMIHGDVEIDSNGDNNAGLYIRGKPYPKPTMSRFQPVVSIVGDHIRTNHIQSEKITTNEINSSSELLILQKNGKENSKNLEVQAKISNIGGKVFNNEMREVGLGLGAGP